MSDTGSSSSASSSSEVFDASQIVPPQTQTQTPAQNEVNPVDPLPPSFFVDLSVTNLNPSSSNELLSSSFSNCITNTQSSTHLTSDNVSQLLLTKSTPLTAPTRSWISQRIAKTIHIDEDDSNNSDKSQKNSLHPNPSSSSQRIIELGIVEEQLSQLLSLASDVLGALTPPLDQDQSTTDEAIENFSNSIGEYFELLNKIQLGLRTSMAHLRVGRISTRILFEPAHVRVPNCPVGLGNVRLDDPPLRPPPSSSRTFNINQESSDRDASSLSLGSLIAERNAWKDFVNSLESFKALHSNNPSDSLFPSLS